MLRFFLPLVFCLLLAVPAPASASTLVFGLPSSGSARAVERMWEPLLEDMSRQLGRPVEARVFDDYAGVVWGLREGTVQMAWLGNKGAIEAVDRAGASVGAQVVNGNGMHGYYAHLIAGKDTGLEDVDDVIARAAELTFGNGDPNSTSGSLVPGYYVFASRGLDPARLFKRMTQAGHESNFLAVAGGEADVATSNSADLERLTKRYPNKAGRVKVIWTSPLIPSDPVVFASNLPAGVQDDVVAFLSRYGAPAEGKPEQQLEREREVLAGLTWFGFRPSDNSQLAPIRKLKLFKELLQTRENPLLSEEQRETRIQELEKELGKLEAGR